MPEVHQIHLEPHIHIMHQSLASFAGNGKQLSSLPIVEDSRQNPRQNNSSRQACLKKAKTREYDRARHALQSPISGEKCRVLYQANGKGKASPWFYTKARGRAALEIIGAKHGHRNAILFVD